MDDKDCLNLIDVCYGAISSPSEWQRFVELLTEALNADAGDFVIEDYASGVADPLGSTGFDPTLRLAYDEDFLGHNPWLSKLQKLPRFQAFSNDHEPSDFERSAYFNEWVRPQRFRHALGGFVEETPTRVFHLGVLRNPDRPRFTPHEIHAINRIFPHVRRAIGLSELVGDLGACDGPIVKLIDSFRCAAFLLDAGGTICEMNGWAEELLRSGHGLRVCSGKLTFSYYEAEKTLSQSIHTACQVEEIARGNLRAEIILPSQDASRPPLLAAAIPLRGYAFCAASRPRCLLLITDPAVTGRDTAGILKRMWRLTPTEVRLALALAKSETATEFAADMSISIGTARWHLKNLQSKAGVNNLPTLVGLIRSIALRH